MPTFSKSIGLTDWQTDIAVPRDAASFDKNNPGFYGAEAQCGYKKGIRLTFINPPTHNSVDMICMSN